MTEGQALDLEAKTRKAERVLMRQARTLELHLLRNHFDRSPCPTADPLAEIGKDDAGYFGELVLEMFFRHSGASFQFLGPARYKTDERVKAQAFLCPTESGLTPMSAPDFLVSISDCTLAAEAKAIASKPSFSHKFDAYSVFLELKQLQCYQKYQDSFLIPLFIFFVFLLSGENPVDGIWMASIKDLMGENSKIREFDRPDISGVRKAWIDLADPVKKIASRHAVNLLLREHEPMKPGPRSLTWGKNPASPILSEHSSQ